MDNQQTINKLGTAKVNTLLLSTGIPMIISMMLQAVYNIVDSAFVSNMATNGELALNALTLAFPIQCMMIALSLGTGVGANALLSKTLGQGNMEKVAKTAGNSIFLGIIICILCIIFGIFASDLYISSQTSNPIVHNMAVEYLRICCVIPFGIVFFGIFEKLLQSTGLSTYSTIAQVAGAIINIVLDPILIYGLFGAPSLGVVGAAYATVIGQIGSFVIALFFHITKNKDVKNGIKYIKPSIGIIKEIYAIGLPAIIAQALMSIMTYSLNIILVRISENMVTAYGLFFKIQQFILFAAFGLRDAITPVVSFNHGMGNKKRINQGIKYGMLYTTIIMIIGIAILEIFAKDLANIFGLSGNTKSLCISAIHIISISFLFGGANIAYQGVFQALDSGIQSLIISICRQFLFVIPIAYILSLIAIDNSSLSYIVWFTFPVAEFVSMIIAIILMTNIRKNKIDVLEV